MRVSQVQQTTSLKSGRGARRAGSANGTFEPTRSGAARRAGTTGAPANVSSIDAILALQAVEDPTEQRRRAVQQGSETLDMLDDLKIALLSGQVSPARLARLRTMVARYDEKAAEGELGAVLREIDLRARVELAKIDR
jgi:hypothetical protein